MSLEMASPSYQVPVALGLPLPGLISRKWLELGWTSAEPCAVTLTLSDEVNGIGGSATWYTDRSVLREGCAARGFGKFGSGGVLIQATPARVLHFALGGGPLVRTVVLSSLVSRFLDATYAAVPPDHEAEYMGPSIDRLVEQLQHLAGGEQ